MHKSHYIAPAKLFIPGSQSDELSYTFFEPITGSSESTRGIFGIFQVHSTSDLYHNLISQTVKKFTEYFRHPDRNSPTEQRGATGEYIFENALQYTSTQLSHYLQDIASREGNAKFDVRRVSFVIGMIWDNELYLCSIGRAVSAYYLYPSAREQAISHYAVVDVLAGNDDQGEINDISELFSQVVSGTVSIAESTLILCNRSFLEYVSLDQIKQAVTSYPNERLAPYFHNLLGKANLRIDFSALFLKMTQNHEAVAAVAARQQPVSHDSIQGLVTKEKDTETILSPAVGSQVKDVISQSVQSIIVRPFSALKDRVASIEISRITQVFSRVTRSGSRQVIVEKLTSSKASISRSGGSIMQSAKIRFHQLRKQDRGEALKEIIHTTRQGALDLFARGKDKFIALSPNSRALLVVTFLFFFLFIASLFTISGKKAEKQTTKDYESQVQQIEQRANLAEASLIYDDEDKAKGLIGEAEGLLAAFPQKTPAQQADYQRLTQSLTGAKRKISRTYVVTPTVLASLGDQIPSVDSLRLIASDSTYLLTTKDGVYSLDIAKGKVLQINTQAKIAEVRCATASSPTIFYICAPDGKIFILNTKDQTVQPAPITLADGESIDLVTTYNGRLYVADATKGTISRHNKKNDGFSSGTAVVKDSAGNDLTGGQSLVVDGNINLLNSKGQLIKTTGGVAAPVIYPTVDPVLPRVTRLWTSTESNFYYLLSSDNRIIVLDKKTNKLKGQITSDQFSSLRDLTVNEKTKEITLLDGSNVLRVPIEFLK